MKRPMILVVVAGTALLVGAGVVSVSIGGEPNEKALDQRATELRGKLGSVCDRFDFQSREEIDGGLVRPIYCHGPSAPDARVQLFVFSDEDTFDAWREDLLLSETSHGISEHAVFGDDWALIALDEEIAAAAKRRIEA